MSVYAIVKHKLLSDHLSVLRISTSAACRPEARSFKEENMLELLLIKRQRLA